MYSRRRFMKFGLTAAVVVIVAGAGGYFALQQPSAPPPAPATPAPATSPATTPAASPTVTVTAPAPTRSPSPTPTPAPVRSFIFTVQDQSSPWAFVFDGEDNPTINVNVGDIVEITLNNDGQIVHNWTLDADSPSPYDVTTADVFAGESDTISFVADKPGTFNYYCAIPGHRDLGMVGELIVS
ncbi:MAG: cupredoxin domain-containing protein [Candidatus Bathyarchaeia archaeon]